MTKKKKIILIAGGAVVVVLAVVLVLWLTVFRTPGFSSYADQEIEIIGLLDEDFTVTPAELAQLDCVMTSTTGNTKKAQGTIYAYGPTLETFLAQYDVTLDQLRSMKAVGLDDYTVTLGKTTWDKYTINLAVKNGKKQLLERQRTLRIIIPGADSGKWIREIGQLIFTYNE